jgi:ribonuclease HI
MNQVLIQLEEWGKKCGLTFNAAKTEAVLFSRDNPAKRKGVIPTLYMSGKRVQLSESVKYLGVTLDRRLFWTEHINDKIAMCKKLMMKIFSEVRGNFGPKPKLIKWAYEGIIRPKLTYACLAWGHEVKTKAILTKLKALDRLATRSMATITRGCPQASVEILTDLMPIELLILKLGLAASIRLREVLPAPCVNYTNKTKRHNLPHLQYWQDKSKIFNLASEATDLCAETVWERQYHVNTDSFDGHKKHRKHSEYTIYTDGSKTDLGTGSGFVIYNKREVVTYQSIKLNDNATVFQAEVTAIRLAAEYLIRHFNARYVKFLSDSQAALLALKNTEISARSVLQAAEALEVLCADGITVRLAWIKAHCGLEGNELADSAAKLGGADEMGINPRVHIPRSAAEVKENLDKAIRNEWEKQWTSSPKYRMTKQFITKPNKHRGSRVAELSKSSLSRLIQLITGHNFLSYFQYQMDSGINPLCRLCEEENETFHHLVYACPAIALKRREMFQDKPPETDKWAPKALIDFSYIEPIDSWLTDRGYLLEQPILELEVNYSITDSDDSL